MADALQIIRKFRKGTSGTQGEEFSYRPIECTWQCQPLFDADRAPIKGAQIRLREDGVGDELSNSLSKMAKRQIYLTN